MKFLDLAKVHIRSGSGGSGAVSFRREKYIEYGGPDGGDGGNGGSVTVEVVDGLNTLIDFRYQRHFFADNGGGGMGQQRTGASGKEIILRVPAGTEVLDEDRETVLADLSEIGTFISNHLQIRPRDGLIRDRPGLSEPFGFVSSLSRMQVFLGFQMLVSLLFWRRPPTHALK
jgi:hypothetical protein